MSLENRVEKLEAEQMREFSALLRTTSTEALREFCESLPGHEMLEAMSVAKLEQLASGDETVLSPQERAALEGPIPREAREILRKGCLAGVTPCQRDRLRRK